MKIPFGLADITIGTGETAIKFDGENLFQADAAEISIEPILEAVNVADFGDTDYDDFINGYSGEITIVAAQHTLELMTVSMAYANKIMSADNATQVGLTDSRIGTSMRERGLPMTIHPREMEDDTSLDFHLYKVASVGEYSRSYANEQGNNELTFKMYPRDGAKANSGSNFYYVGDVDPNAPAPTEPTA
ncbi:tail tube [Bacillus phage 055SW001]|nr:tail tube [Bacillus phage 022DV001]QFG05423.1 tail tube [Bacillus phage 031MP003]QFG05513.1 tail tube [Bacillus phage 031MP002]QFG05774.1 tail tube [Bacillus phage 055SW001]